MSVISFADDCVLLRAGMRSNAATDSGISYGVSQATPGTPTYSSQGADFDGSAKAIQFQLDTQHPNDYAKLATGGRLKFTVPMTLLDRDLSLGAASTIISKTQGWVLKNTAQYTLCRFPESTGILPNTMTYHVQDEEKPDRVEVVVGWNEKQQWMAVDGLFMGGNTPAMMITGSPVSEWTDFYVGGLTSSAGTYPEGYPVSDVALSYEPFYYSRHLKYGRVLFIGDSITTQGSAYSTHQGLLLPWDPGGGFTAVPAPNASGNFASDNSYIQQFARGMAKGGVFIGGGANEAQSGGSIATGHTRTTNWFAAGNEADIACVLLGTNNMSGDDEAGWRSGLRGIVDECATAGVKKIVFGTVISLRNDPTYQTQTYNDRNEAINRVINEMPAYNSIASVVDLFTLFGGFDLDSDDFQAANLHPSAQGSAKIGSYMAMGALAAIQAGDRPITTRPRI